MPKNKKFRLRPKAELDLVSIYEYSEQEFGSARADQYIRDLDSAFHKLADEPGLASDASHINKNLMVYRVVSHLVFFKSSVCGINIIRVLHNSMDYGRHL